jgi:hypothetical protein
MIIALTLLAMFHVRLPHHLETQVDFPLAAK